jgi:hypothetical protein
MIRAFDMERDYDTLCGWLNHHRIADPDPHFFSDCGFVVDEKAIGFLFKTNSKSCYIDHVAADPAATPADRQLALLKLFRHLEETAKADGFDMITALAKLSAMKQHFEGRQFKPFGDFTLYFKFLGDT